MRELRVERGLSLRDVERETGISRAILSQIETGRMVANEDELVEVGRYLGVHLALRLTPIAEVPA